MIERQWSALWCLPGCLPEMEPASFDTFEDARSFVCEELKTQADAEVFEHHDYEASSYWHECWREAFDASDSFAVDAPDGYVYMVDVL
jgi:hypothetical protein